MQRNTIQSVTVNLCPTPTGGVLNRGHWVSVDAANLTGCYSHSVRTPLLLFSVASSFTRQVTGYHPRMSVRVLPILGHCAIPFLQLC